MTQKIQNTEFHCSDQKSCRRIKPNKHERLLQMIYEQNLVLQII